MPGRLGSRVIVVPGGGIGRVTADGRAAHWSPAMSIRRCTGVSPVPRNRRGRSSRPESGLVSAPEEIAAAAAFLLSDESAFITGAVLPIDGGFTAQQLPNLAVVMVAAVPGGNRAWCFRVPLDPVRAAMTRTSRTSGSLRW